MLNKSKKVGFVEREAKELQNYKVVGVANLNGIPDRLLQASRNKMRNDVRLIMGRSSLLKKILESSDRTRPLAERMSGTSAIILSNGDPFDVYQRFRSHAIRLAAKPKQIAPEDITVQGGETSLQPGQAVTELKQAGIDVQIQKGKVVIAKDKLVVKKGDAISASTAKVLRTLGTMPFHAVIEPEVLLANGIMFSKQLLAIDPQKTAQEVAMAFSRAYVLSMELGIVNQYTVVALVTKAVRQAMTLGVEAGAYEPGIIEALLGRAAAQAGSLRGLNQS